MDFDGPLSVCLAGIEVHLFGIQENGDGPLVFVTHGRTGKVEDTFGQCRDLVDLGFIAAAVEQRNHGKRVINAECNLGWGPHHPVDMYGVYIGTAIDVSLLIDLLPARLGVKTDRVGMTGISLGGHATLAAMAHDERIHAGAALIGSGDYRRLMEYRAQENNCPPDDFAKFFPPALEDMVRKYDPVFHPERFADRPLLMANGEVDTLVPLECNQRFERVARPSYEHGNRLRLSVYPGVGHSVPPEMWNEAKEWLTAWLF